MAEARPRCKRAAAETRCQQALIGPEINFPPIDRSGFHRHLGVIAAWSSCGATDRKVHTMKTKTLAITFALMTAPMAALAMPAVGDVVGTNPNDATAALEKAGCKVQDFEAEGGKIEAKCTDEAGKKWEVYIDPKTGAVVEIKDND